MLDNLARGHRAAVPEGAELIELDLLNEVGVRNALADGFDGVLHFASLALVAESVAHPERYHRGQPRRCAQPARRDARGRRAPPRVLLHLRRLRRARQRPDARGHPGRAGQLLRQLQARDRPHDRRRVPRPRAGRRLAALLQRRGRARGPRRGPRAGDAPDPARPQRRRRRDRPREGVRHRLPDARRDGGARLHPHRGPRDRPHPRPRGGRARPPRDLQPRHRPRLHGQGGRRRRPPRDRQRRYPRARSRAGPATRRSWWPPATGSRPSSAGSRRRASTR